METITIPYSWVNVWIKCSPMCEITQHSVWRTINLKKHNTINLKKKTTGTTYWILKMYLALHTLHALADSILTPALSVSAIIMTPLQRQKQRHRELNCFAKNTQLVTSSWEWGSGPPTLFRIPHDPASPLSQKAYTPKASPSHSFKKQSEKGSLSSPKVETIPSLGSGERGWGEISTEVRKCQPPTM